MATCSWPAASPSAARLEASVFEQVEDHLSSEGVFLMGDAQARGFPIRYASHGFEEVYGFSASEIVGKKCGDLIGGPAIASSIASLAAVATAAGLSLKEVEGRVKFLTSKASEACDVMMSHSGSRVGVALLLNRKKSGAIFVCECLVMNLRHPTLNWSYCVGFQRDISAGVPPCTLLAAAASDAAYSELVQSRGAALEQRREVLLGVGSENVVRYLHEKAMDVFSLDIWRTLRNELMFSVEATAPPDADAAALAASPALALAPAPASAATPPPRRPLDIPEMLGGGRQAQRGAAASSLAMALHGGNQRRPPSASAFAPAPAQVSGRPGALATREPPAGGYHLAVPMKERGAELPWSLIETNSVVEFLNDVGLRRYAEHLLVSGFDDMDTLVEISDEDFKDLGIPRGHALKLKRSLRAFQCLQICAGNPATCAAQDGQQEPCLEEQRQERQTAAMSRAERVTLATSFPARSAQAPVQSAPAVSGGAVGGELALAQRAATGAKTAVEISWDKVQEHGAERFGEQLFVELFRSCPGAGELFPPEVCEKYWDWSMEPSPICGVGDFAGVPRRGGSASPMAPKLFGKVVNLIGGAVVGLHSAQHLVPNLTRLGLRHSGYGVEAAHLQALGQALAQTLRRVLGEACTPEVELAWMIVYNFVSASMAGGLQQGLPQGGAPPPAPTLLGGSDAAAAKAAAKTKEGRSISGAGEWRASTPPTLLQKLRTRPSAACS